MAKSSVASVINVRRVDGDSMNIQLKLDSFIVKLVGVLSKKGVE